MQDYCGDEKEIQLGNEETSSIKISDLPLGSSCLYQVKTSEGVPAFKLASEDDSGEFEI